MEVFSRKKTVAYFPYPHYSLFNTFCIESTVYIYRYYNITKITLRL